MNRIIQITTTTDRREEAQTIAELLVDKKLAACVQVVGPIASTYRWQDEVTTAEEWLLLIKTTEAAYEGVEQAICSLHSYEVPEIIATVIERGSPSYLCWVEEQVE